MIFQGSAGAKSTAGLAFVGGTAACHTLGAPEIVAVIVGILGIIWYSLIIGEKLYGFWRKLEHKETPDAPDPIPEVHKDK